MPRGSWLARGPERRGWVENNPARTRRRESTAVGRPCVGRDGAPGAAGCEPGASGGSASEGRRGSSSAAAAATRGFTCSCPVARYVRLRNG